MLLHGFFVNQGINTAWLKTGNQRRAGAPPNEGELIRQRKENQAIAQLLLICGSFLFGYVPFCGEILQKNFILKLKGSLTNSLYYIIPAKSAMLPVGSCNTTKKYSFWTLHFYVKLAHAVNLYLKQKKLIINWFLCVCSLPYIYRFLISGNKKQPHPHVVGGSITRHPDAI